MKKQLALAAKRVGIAFLLVVAGAGAEESAVAGSPLSPPPGKPSRQTYRVRWRPGAQITLDGRADEPAWMQAVVNRRFALPWKRAKAPKTEFRALCDGMHLFFTFRVQDADTVVLDHLRDELDVVLEDRVEVFLGRDDQMQDYYCFEVDARGRVYDYRGSYYRRLEAKWQCMGLETRGVLLPGGYEVEGRIPLESLVALGFPALRPGVKIRGGLYRAEFSHDRSGRPIEPQTSVHNLGRKAEGPPPVEEWISWVDPKTRDPDFHVPASLGWLKVVR